MVHVEKLFFGWQPVFHLRDEHESLFKICFGRGEVDGGRQKIADGKISAL